MNTPLRLAFLGIDNPHGSGWRELLAENFAEDIAIAAIMPGLDGAVASLEERLADVPRFDTVEALIAGGEFDAAMVCLPNNVGVDAICQLARAGKHLLIEKPTAGSAADARRIADAVNGANVAYQCGYMWRYDEGVNRLRRMAAEGQFGKLIAVETLFVTSDVFRRGPQHYLFDKEVSGGGFFNWLACHWLDLLLYVTDRPIVAVTARCGVYGETPVEVEDGGAVIVELEGGALATFIGGYWLPRWAGESQWTIRGSQRWVRWDPTRPGTSGALEIHGPMPQWFAMEETFQTPPDNTPGYGGGRGVALVRDWLDKIERGGSCRNTPESALATLELIDAIYQSSREDRTVRFGEQSQ